MNKSIVIGGIFKINTGNIFHILFYESLWKSMDVSSEYIATRMSEINDIRIEILSIDKIDDKINSITWFNGKTHHTSSHSMFMENFIIVE